MSKFKICKQLMQIPFVTKMEFAVFAVCPQIPLAKVPAQEERRGDRSRSQAMRLAGPVPKRHAVRAREPRSVREELDLPIAFPRLFNQ